MNEMKLRGCDFAAMGLLALFLAAVILMRIY